MYESTEYSETLIRFNNSFNIATQLTVILIIRGITMNAQLLDYSMFDDGSLECKTFCIATHDDARIVEYSVIKEAFPENLERIRKAVDQGKHHLGCHNEFGYFEIQWD